MDRPSLVNCKPNDIFNALKRLDARFACVSAGRHNFKIGHPLVKNPFPLPNRTPINRHVVNDIIDEILIGVLKLSEEEIYKELRC